MKNSEKLQNQVRKQRQIKIITDNIEENFRQSSKSLLNIGKHFYELQKLMGWQELINLAKARWSISRMSVRRFLQIYLAFKDHDEKMIAKAKPSVLYLLSVASSDTDVIRLMKGFKINLNGRLKGIESLTVKDAQHIKARKKSSTFRTQKKECRESDLIHYKLATAIEAVDDVSKTAIRYIKTGVEIKERTLLKNYLRVAITNLTSVERTL